MAWWDSRHRDPGASPRSKPRLIMGDAFPRLEPPHINGHLRMEWERALLSPVFEEQLGPPTTPALVVHIEVRFTDPVIRSRYCRSYGSSPGFEATNRMCRGLVRRIERCSEEFLTRKDSGALGAFKGDTHERKPQRFEMTFRVMRRGKGEWAERVYRSYQKQPLTVAFTREIILTTHRIIGLFLSRHDDNFQWPDSPVPEEDSGGTQTMVPSRDGPPSLLSIPRSRFIEATQIFESVPGYSIELCFRSRNPQRNLPVFERRIKVDSTQTAPLTLFMSEDVLWKALQALNQGLDSKKRDFDDRFRHEPALDTPSPWDGALVIDLGISNNLGPVYDHVRRSLNSRLALFHDQEAKDCREFLLDTERLLIQIRDDADAILNAMNDLEFRIVELKGVGWSLREPAKFTRGPSASYGRRTIQAALDRIQTGIEDVIRGHNVAIHIDACKRGHLVLDKAIVAHERRGKPKETFASREEAQATFVARLKARVQRDIDKVFEDSCSIDDIPEDEEDYFMRPSTPAQPEQGLSEGRLSPGGSPSSIRSSPARQSKSLLATTQDSPGVRSQRVFSLSRRSAESVRSINYLKAAPDSFADYNSQPSTAASEQAPKMYAGRLPVPASPTPLLAPAEVRSAQRSSSLASRPSSADRLSNGSSLVQGKTVNDGDTKGDSEAHTESPHVQQLLVESRSRMTSSEGEVSRTATPSGSLLAEGTPAVGLCIAPNPTAQQLKVPCRTEGSTNQHRKMDTPETFVDAREYPASPKPEERTKSRPSDISARATNPREDDEFSTAPSTPELSTGTSSPRHSVLITPVYMRTSSGVKDPVLRYYPESEPGDSDIHERGDAVEPQLSKESRDRSATDGPPISRSNLDPLQSTKAAERPAGACASASNDGQDASQSSDPAARFVLHSESPDIKATSTPPLATPSVAHSEVNADSKTASELQVYTANVGAELTEGSETHSHVPDFPTPHVRGSGPNRGLVHGPVFRVPEHGPAQTSDRGLESLLQPTFHATGTAGSALGTAPGAETKLFEDNVSRGVKDDACEESPGSYLEERYGAELEMLLSQSRVAGETTKKGAEGPPEDPGHGDLAKGKVWRGNTGPDMDNTERDVGSEDTVDGAGLIADNYEREKSAAHLAASHDVGSAKETGGILGGDGVDVRIPGTAEEQSDGDHGPGSGTETHAESNNGISDKVAEAAEEHLEGEDDPGSGGKAHVEPGDGILNRVAALAEPNQPTTEANIKGRVTPSESSAVLVEVESPAPTDLGAEEGEEIKSGGDTRPSWSEFSAEYAKAGNAGTTSQHALSESQATAPEPGRDVLRGGEQGYEGPNACPSKTDAVELEVSDQEVHDRAGGDSTTAPTRVDTGAGDASKQDVAEGGQGKPIPPLVVDIVDTEISEPSVDGEGKGLIAIPPVPGAAELETSEQDTDKKAAQNVAGSVDGLNRLSPGDRDGTDTVRAEFAEKDNGDKHVTPAYAVEDLTAVLPESSAVTAKPDLLAGVAREPSAAEEATPMPASKREMTQKEHSHLAPIPGLSKLLATATTSGLSSNHPTSLAGAGRNSVDTIRPSTDEQYPPAIPGHDAPHVSSSRPQTAGYLGVGLRESRFMEMGLRGALGDFKARRRLSLPLQHMLDEQAMEGLSLVAGRSSGPSSEAGGKAPRLRKRRVDVGERGGGGEGDDAQASVLPRMMMLLAGAVAIGKIMKKAGE